jgi:hypothetical protein
MCAFVPAVILNAGNGFLRKLKNGLQGLLLVGQVSCALLQMDRREVSGIGG